MGADTNQPRSAISESADICADILVVARHQPCVLQMLYEKLFNFKISGNEVYYTNLLSLLIKMMLCSKLHCQKFLH